MNKCENQEINFFASCKKKDVNRFISVSEYLINYVKSGLNGHKERVLGIQKKILQDEDYRFSETYKVEKGKLPAVVLHAQFKNYLKTCNLTSFNDLLFLDFDGLSDGEILQLKSFLQSQPYIIAVYRSLSLHGIHAVMAIDGIKSIKDYHAAYRYMTVLVYNQFGFLLCPGANASTQLTIMGYDPDIFINPDPKPFHYVFDKFAEAQYYVHYPRNNRRNTLDLDAYLTDTLFDQSKFNYYNYKLGKNYYANLILVDQATQFPVPASAKYDARKHSLMRYFEKEQIEQVEFHNESRTLALFNEKIACITLSLWEKRRFYHGSRTSTMMAIMMDYAFINKYFKGMSCLSMQDLFCMACVLNDRCITTGDDPVMFPLKPDTLLFISKCVFEAYTSDNIIPKQSERSTIYSVKLFDLCKGNMAEKNSKSILFTEINKLICRKRKEVNDKSIYSAWENILSRNELITPPELKNEIQQITGLSKSAIESRLSKPAKTHFTNNTLNCNTLCTKREMAGLKIEECIDILVWTENLISQEIVSEKTGISLRGIQRHWSKFKERAKLHNKNIKQKVKAEQCELIKQVKELLLEMDFGPEPEYSEQEAKFAERIKWNVSYYDSVDISLEDVLHLVARHRAEQIDYESLLSAGVGLTEESPFKDELIEMVGKGSVTPEYEKIDKLV